MKLKINNKYEEVDLWSFLKCHLIASLVLAILLYGTLAALGILISLVI